MKLTEPDSELTLRCAAYLVETLYHTSQNELARVEALQISLDWSESEHYFQLWKVFCYFTFCHVSNDTSPLEVREITTNWIQTLFIVNDQCECIKWIILGIVNMEENRMDEASQLLEKGLTKCLPNSFITAQTSLHLADLYLMQEKLHQAEEVLLSARSILSSHYPTSAYMGRSLLDLGCVMVEMDRTDEGKDFLQACDFFAMNFPNGGEYTDCLCNLGDLLKKTGLQSEALEKYELACRVYSVYAATSLEFAMCLVNFGSLYKDVVSISRITFFTVKV